MSPDKQLLVTFIRLSSYHLVFVLLIIIIYVPITKCCGVNVGNFCLIILSGDVEINPGSKNSVSECLSICHWNLNSISVHAWLFQIICFEGIYISVHQFDIICLSEAYLDSTVPPDDDNFVISRYNLILSDHQSNTKRGGACLYYKNCLPLSVLNISYLKECLNFELKIGDKSCNFVALYMSPSQS